MHNDPRNRPASRLQQLRDRFRSADERNAQEPDAYRDITADIRDQSQQRHEKKIADIGDLQDKIRLKLIRNFALCAALLLATALITYLALTYNNNLELTLNDNLTVSLDNNEPAPESLATWIEQQKMLKQIAQVQQWLNSGEAESDLPPPTNMEELRAWLDNIKLSPDLQQIEEETAGGGPGFVPFQCPAVPIPCAAEDIPSAAGEGRVELSHLVRNANTMLVENGNCEGTVNLIGEYDNLFGWRKSEAITKSLLEISVARCFMTAEDTSNAEVHFTRAYCSSVSDPDPHEAMNSLYGLAKISWQNNDQEKLNGYVQCSENLLDYHLQADPDVNTLNNFITLALMHYELTGDTRESIRIEEKGMTAARELAPTLEDHQIEDHLEVMLILQMNLMEGYLTLGETEPLYRLHEDLKSNPMLEDGDRLVARGLLAMQDLVDNNNASARTHLEVIAARYKTLSEFTTVWSWDAFDRWQEETKSTRSKKVDDQIKELRIILDTERPADSQQRLSSLLAELAGS